MTDKNFEVIIVGGSYSGLAAGMALGRALKKVLIIDDEKPCNRQTPYSHNFITQDGRRPGEIASIAKEQVATYETVKFLRALATEAAKTNKGFEIRTGTGETFTATKLIFATGILDIMPQIPGVSECWGISVLHCPYCHGYEVRNQETGILGGGTDDFEYTSLISNWTKDLILYTNGKSKLTPDQVDKLRKHDIKIVETEIEKLEHHNGYVQHVIFSNGEKVPASILYTRTAFLQHCSIPELLGCELNEEGYIKVDASQKTTVEGVFACGDNTTRVRTVANAVAMGTTAGMTVSREMIFEEFVK